MKHNVELLASYWTLAGSAGDPDIFGAQQYAPLLDIMVPERS